MSPIDTARLLAGLQQGDDRATRHFVDIYYEPLLRHLVRMLQDRQAAEDVCQELFVRAIQCIDQVRDPKSLKTWLYRVATNLAHDHLRRRRDTPIPDVPFSAAASDDVDRLPERLHVTELLRTLSPDHRGVLILRFYEDMSLPEISEILEIPVGTVKSRLHYALRQLRRHLENEGQEVVARGVQRGRPYPSHVG